MRGSLLLIVLATGASSAVAVTIQECTLPDGSKVFQDKPCPPQSTAKQREIDEPKVSAPAEGMPPPAATAGVTAPVAADTPPPSRKALIKTRYRCLRPEGGDYVSNFENREPRWVPLWTVERPNLMVQSGGSSVAVGGKFRAGERRPEAVAQAETGSNLVLVRDQCLPLNGSELCTYLRKERDRLHGEIQRAFNDTRATLEAEAADVFAEIQARCL